MPHPFADDADGDVVCLCGTGPRMAGHIHGDRLLYAEGFGNVFQMVVHQMEGTSMLFPLISFLLDDGEQVWGGIVRWMGFQDFFHAFLPFDGKFLACLSSSIS